MNLLKDKYIIVEVIPTSSDSKKGIIAQLSALKLDGIKLIDRFDYRIDEKLVNNKDLLEMISYDKDNFKYTDNPSFYLSKNLKFIKVHPVSGKNDYSILRDTNFKKMSDNLFDKLWNYGEELILSDKDDILDRVAKSISYTRIINKTLGEDVR